MSVKVEAQTAEGDVLVWAVCQALGLNPVIADTGITYRDEGHGSWVYPRFLDDSDAGELMATHWIGAERPSSGQVEPVWRAITDSKINDPRRYKPVVSAFGKTLGLAVCRALVISRLGEKFDVPDELMK